MYIGYVEVDHHLICSYEFRSCMHKKETVLSFFFPYQMLIYISLSTNAILKYYFCTILKNKVAVVVLTSKNYTNTILKIKKHFSMSSIDTHRTTRAPQVGMVSSFEDSWRRYLSSSLPWGLMETLSMCEHRLFKVLAFGLLQIFYSRLTSEEGLRTPNI